MLLRTLAVTLLSGILCLQPAIAEVAPPPVAAESVPAASIPVAPPTVVATPDAPVSPAAVTTPDAPVPPLP